jgi:sulfite exporter TauE/SafE
MLLTGFILGLAGSLHCVGMCGAIALALPNAGSGRTSFLLSRVAYNFGRVATYCGLGMLAGVFGQAAAFAGFQRWLSVLAGALILAGLVLARVPGRGAAVRFVSWLKRSLGLLLRQRSYSSLLALGAANGLLPCGLVYAAMIAAGATGNVVSAAHFMIAFGLGTFPLMLALPLLSRCLSRRLNLQYLVPASAAIVAILLIVRGLSLGIPYLSPALPLDNASISQCH